VSYLLDTNVLSELRRRTPNPAVAAWFEAAAGDDLFLSVLVIGEIRQGIERLRPRDPAQAGVFEQWLAALKRDYADRVLPVTSAVAEAWGRLDVLAALPAIDGLLVATASVHGLTFVTRDVDRLALTGASLLNPWR
jgi:predicted nucleic acid-binding protein